MQRRLLIVFVKLCRGTESHRSSRVEGFVIPDKEEQTTDASDFELITWLVTKSEGTDG